MLLIIILQISIVILFYGLFLCNEVRKKIDYKSGNWLNYNTIFLFIHFFIFGYAGFTIQLIYDEITQNNFDFNIGALVTSILFFGAIFIVVVLKINQNLLFYLEKTKNHLKDANIQLEKSYEELGDEAEKVKEYQKYIKQKNHDLEKAINDFYSLRVEMQEKADNKDINTENEIIKKRIDDMNKK